MRRGRCATDRRCGGRRRHRAATDRAGARRRAAVSACGLFTGGDVACRRDDPRRASVVGHDDHAVDVGKDDVVPGHGDVSRAMPPRAHAGCGCAAPAGRPERAERPDRNADRLNRIGIAMGAPDDDAGQAGDVCLAGHEIANAAFVEPAGVVDDEHVAALGRGDGLEKDVDAARVTRRTRAPGDPCGHPQRPERLRADANRQLQLRARVGDEWRRPVESPRSRSRVIGFDPIAVHRDHVARFSGLEGFPAACELVRAPFHFAIRPRRNAARACSTAASASRDALAPRRLARALALRVGLAFGRSRRARSLRFFALPGRGAAAARRFRPCAFAVMAGRRSQWRAGRAATPASASNPCGFSGRSSRPSASRRTDSDSRVSVTAAIVAADADSPASPRILRMFSVAAFDRFAMRFSASRMSTGLAREQRAVRAAECSARFDEPIVDGAFPVELIHGPRRDTRLLQCLDVGAVLAEPLGQRVARCRELARAAAGRDDRAPPHARRVTPLPTTSVSPAGFFASFTRRSDRVQDTPPSASIFVRPCRRRRDSSSSDCGLRRARSRSVVSWKITYGGTPRERASSTASRAAVRRARDRRLPTTRHLAPASRAPHPSPAAAVARARSRRDSTRLSAGPRQPPSTAALDNRRRSAAAIRARAVDRYTHGLRRSTHRGASRRC